MIGDEFTHADMGDPDRPAELARRRAADPWIDLDRALRRVEDALASDGATHTAAYCPGCEVGALADELRVALYEYRGWVGPFVWPAFYERDDRD